MQVLLTAITLVLFFFAIRQFFIREIPRYGRLILGVLILNRVVLNGLYLLAQGGLLSTYPILLRFSAPFFYASPGLVFLYVQGVLYPSRNWKKSDWWHIIPVLFGFLEVVPWFFSSTENMLQDVYQVNLSKGPFFQYFTGWVSQQSGFLVRPALQLVYLISLWWQVYVLIRVNKFYAEDLNRRHWVLFILSMATASLVVSGFQVASIHFPSLMRQIHFPPSYLLHLLNIMILLGFLFFIFQKPVILAQYVLGFSNQKNVDYFTDVKRIAIPADRETPPVNAEGGGYKKVLSVLEAEELFLRAKAIMIEQSLYRQPQLHLADVASALDVPAHHLSFCLNKHKGLSFREWINQARIEAFLEDYPRLNQTMTIEAQARHCGFKNVSAFYLAFKKSKKCSPKDFLSSLSQKKAD